MTGNDLLPPAVLTRKAVVYVRQSTPGQVQNNLESQRRQYELVDVARRWGFHDVEVIDDDLGRTASGTVDRPGFERLVSGLCTGKVGAVLCFDASRLSRNGRDWHHLLELCGLVEARVIDLDGVYDPCRPNDRLLLGMKGSISEFELGILRTRMLDAARAKARRGELRISVPIGYIWHRDYGLGLDPDLRVQEAVRLIFARFRALGSARRVLISLTAEHFHFPRPSDGRKTVSFDWVPIRYRSIISILKNPFYAGVYVYGKSEKRTEIVDGRASKSYGHSKPFGTWEVLLQDHHEGYIEWSEFERNQGHIAVNAFGRKGGVKSGRGGRALLAGLLTCGRCGRRLGVVYSGRPPGHPYYRCERINQMLAKPRCMTFGASRIDPAIGREILRAVTPMAIEAAMEADRAHRANQDERHRMAELDLQQAHYEASLAERRYAACDPDNRLIAAQLEKSWEAALRRVEVCKARLEEARQVELATPLPDFTGIAADLDAAWRAPKVDMRCRQRLLRARAYETRGEPHCQSIAGWPIDEAIGELIAAEMTPTAVELALEIRKEIEVRHDEADQLRLRAVERAQIDADLAQRRFMLVDPNNRLVADTLEREWNDKLRMLADVQEERERALREDRMALDDAIRDRLIAMTADFKTVWCDPTLPNRERKRLLAYLVEDVTLLKIPTEGETRIHIRFRGGRTETLTTQNPKSSAQQVKTRPEVVELVDKLLDDHICAEIAEILNAKGILPGGSARRDRTGAQFTDLRVIYLVKQYGLRPRYDRLRERGMLTKAEACAKLGITECTLVRWAKYGIVKRHAYNGYIGLYEPPGPHVPAKHCSRWNPLARRAEAIRQLSASKCTDVDERAVV